jgi:redox-sensitive bicupin YhaK (pirin superfamily)
MPGKPGLEPSYEQKMYTDEEKRGQLRLIASQDGRDGSVTIHQDVNVFAALLDQGQEISHQLTSAGRHGWLQVARGAVAINGHELQQSDGAGLSEEQSLKIVAREPSEILLFDLA